jgi:hypothetical protein
MTKQSTKTMLSEHLKRQIRAVRNTANQSSGDKTAASKSCSKIGVLNDTTTTVLNSHFKVLTSP